MIGDQVLVDGETIPLDVMLADGPGTAIAEISIVDGKLTLTFDEADRVQSLDLSAESGQAFQVRLPQHSDDDFQLNLEVTAKEHLIDGELDTNNNEATHQAVLNVEVKAVADGANFTPKPAPLSFLAANQSDTAHQAPN